MPVKEIYTAHEERMQKSLDSLKRELGSIRTGRATPALLERVQVEYYGTLTPVNQVANVSIPDPRSILIQPWEQSLVAEIERAIMKSDLGLTPNSDGATIRLNLPQLTQERRAEFVKVANKKTEEAKVAIRNIRRDANDLLKKIEKDKSVPEDELKKAQDEIQKLTDRYIKESDSVLGIKEKEIMEV